MVVSGFKLCKSPRLNSAPAIGSKSISTSAKEIRNLPQKAYSGWENVKTWSVNICPNPNSAQMDNYFVEIFNKRLFFTLKKWEPELTKKYCSSQKKTGL